jgi:thiamine biosynthesis lipoprotein
MLHPLTTHSLRRLLCRCLCLCLFLPAALHAEWLQEARDIMGTRVSVELWSEDPALGREAIVEAMEEMQRIDLMMNPWNPQSELSRVNREAASGPVISTPEIVQVVSKALYFSRLSDGAFDISFASVGQHYDYRAGVAPTEEELEQDRPNIDYRAIKLDVATASIEFALPGLQIDLGGIAKGFAVDQAIAILQRRGIQAAVVSAGGDSRILGDLGDRPRTIGIRHPRRKDEYAVVIPLADTAISTSGDYERFFMEEGVRFHHILDPGTGRSADGVQSASVLTALAVDSDALSTTTFVLGVERGLELINRLPGVDAIIIDAEGRLHYSEELLLSTTP